MNELALFAGSGGGILGGHLLGWRTVCAVEWEPYPASVLVARQNEGILPPFPIWDDVQTFDGRPWRGIVDVVSGGFPCQDISLAGKGAGIDGERSGMWRHMARIIDEVRPRFAFVENSPALIRRGLARVIGDLAEIGYDCRWCIMGADDVGAPHRRKRIWILACPVSSRERREPWEKTVEKDALADTNEIRRQYIGDNRTAKQGNPTVGGSRENMGADDAGAPHRRKRIWILAHPVSTGERWQQREGEIKGDALAYATDDGTGWRKQQPQGGEGPRHVAHSRLSEPQGRDKNEEGQQCSDRRASWGEPASCSSLANADGFERRSGTKREDGKKISNSGKELADTISKRQPRPGEHWFSSDPAEKREGETDHAESKRLDRIWGIESRLGRVAHGVANRVDRLKAIGNGQVPAVAAAAFRYLSQGLI